MDWCRPLNSLACCEPHAVTHADEVAASSNTFGENRNGMGMAHNPAVGVGIVFREDKEAGGGLRVVAVAKGSPAMQSRVITPGLKLIAIDKKEVSRFAAPDIAPYILGSPGSKVTLTFENPDSADQFAVDMQRGWAGGQTAEG